MKKLIILTDEESEFLVSKADFKNFTSMDVEKIRSCFSAEAFDVIVCKFSDLDLKKSYSGVYVLYQSSEAPGAFYKRYIEDIIYFLENQGAIVFPKYELLKAHHNKVFMELMRLKFTDRALKTLSSKCYGSWVDARNYDSDFPVVIKQSSNSGSAGVFLAKNKKEYDKLVRKAGHVLIASGLGDLIVTWVKNIGKKIIKYFEPAKSKYVRYNTSPVSNSIIVQPFVPGLKGDYKVLIFGKKYYCMYRKNRDNDFRASGSGRFHEVPEEAHEGLLTFARKLTSEIDFPIFGMDIGYNGKAYYLLEFQMIDLGPSALQRSRFWHEFHDGEWIRLDGKSVLEEEFSRAIIDYIKLHQL